MYDSTGVFSSTHTAVVPTCAVKAGIQPKIAQISHDEIIKGNSFLFAIKAIYIRSKNNTLFIKT